MSETGHSLELPSQAATVAPATGDARNVDADRVRAIQYVRTSSDDQRQSLENQFTAIAEYADRRGYEIVATYVDAGKSGLSLKGRHGSGNCSLPCFVQSATSKQSLSLMLVDPTSPGRKAKKLNRPRNQ